MTEIPEWKQEIAEQVHSILLDYPHSIAIFREKAGEFCAATQRYLDAREKVDPAEITDEEFDSLISGSNTWPDKDETAVKNIPPDPIRGGEYSKRPATKEEKFHEQCAGLAVLHDSILRKELQESNVILTDGSLACLLVKRLFIRNDAGYDRKFYEGALEAVKARLSTEQKDERNKFMITARSSQENWEAIKSEYGISKMDFGKKINFVSDSFKRQVIFRDVEHAFVLASQGFPKPSLILAGGVIEELLRLYLEHKNIPATGDKFFLYIKACEDNGLLKRGVSRLTDSIRDFRNLVHLSNEKTKSHAISKATAKGAVSSIFTIANDFQ